MKLKLKKNKLKDLSKNKQSLPAQATPLVAGGSFTNLSQIDIVAGSCGYLGCEMR